MMDVKLVFCEDQAATAAFTSSAIDFGQKAPTTGLNDHELYVVIKATTECTGTGTLTLTLEQSDEAAANFSTALVTGALTADELNAGVALHLPIKHKRYLRLKGAASTTALTAGAVTSYLSDVFDARFIVPKEGIEFIATTH